MTDFDPSRFIQMLAARGHNGELGIRYVGHGEDHVELMLPYDPALAADAVSGVLASGPIVTLMDMATSAAIWVREKRLRPQATLDLRVDYLRPARPGQNIYGRGECYRVTRYVAFVRGIAHDGDAADPVAHVAGTFMFLDEEQPR